MPTAPKVWNSQQSWHYEAVVPAEDGAPPLRFTIRQNAYPFQSYARVEQWDGDLWNEVARLPGELLRNGVSYVSPGITPEHFTADVGQLIEAAEVVLGPLGIARLQAAGLKAAGLDWPRRSCFVEWPDGAAAIEGIAKMIGAFPGLATVFNVSTTEEGRASVYFGLNTDSGSTAEDDFIAAAIRHGGEYTGS